MRTREDLVEIKRMLDRLTTLLIVRDPGNQLSADAYDALRKMIVQTTKSRRAHISHIVSLRDALDRGASLELIADRVDDFLTELGVVYTSDTSIDLPGAFEIDGGEGSETECIQPAVLDGSDDGRAVVVRPGLAKWVQKRAPESLEN